MSHKPKRERPPDQEMGFQIAPMIDVIFVIMLFFMVLAGNRVVETELKMQLPSTEPSDNADDSPMEESVALDDAGNITHNDSPVSKNELVGNFQRIKQQSDAEGSKVIVTISSAPDTKWEKVADVMDAMQAAKIENVTFSVSEDE